MKNIATNPRKTPRVHPFCVAISAILLLLPGRINAQSDYYRHVIFDNSLNKDGYYFSHAQANGKSFIEQ